jgi:long-chain fatty acid transport protein
MANTYHVARRIQTFGIAILLTMTSGGVHAAGFALIEQSVSSMGTAYAGAGSAAEDASYIFFNPASMSQLDGTQVSGGLHVVLPESKFTGVGTYNSSNPAIINNGDDLIAAGADNDIDAGVDGYIPHLAYVRELNDRMNFGITVNVPFGLKTEYGSEWVGRYSSIESEITTVNINPNLSFKVDDHVTLAFGVSAMYANLIYQNAIDDAFLFTCNPATGACIGPIGSPATDAFGEIDVDDWGFGWNFGALLKPTDSTRLGFAYRSKVEIEMEGDFTSSSTFPPAASSSAGVDASLPDTLLLSAYHEVNPQWAVMADILWTHWSRIDALVIQLGSGGTNTIPLKWEDTYRYAVGAHYKPSERWIFRGGVAFDETPIPSPELRPTALPDEDRVWLDFGVGYRHSRNLSFDFGYAHLFIDDPRIDSTDAYSSGFAPLVEGLHRVTGEYEASTDIISAQVNWKF